MSVVLFGSLRCGKLSARSRCSGLRSRAEDNKPGLAITAAQAGLAIRASQAERKRVPSHASAHIAGCVQSASFACKPSPPHSRHAGPCGCYAVRASRSANPTPSARVHLPPLRSHCPPSVLCESHTAFSYVRLFNIHCLLLFRRQKIPAQLLWGISYNLMRL